jgi:hypothetical protein
MGVDDTTRLTVPRATALARAAHAEAPLMALAQSGVITLIDPWPRLCDARSCGVMQAGQALYFDNNHLTNCAAIALSDLFAPVFEASQ